MEPCELDGLNAIHYEVLNTPPPLCVPCLIGVTFDVYAQKAYGCLKTL